MHLTKRISKLIGVLILGSFLTSILSVASAVDSPDFMGLAATEAHYERAPLKTLIPALTGDLYQAFSIMLEDG